MELATALRASVSHRAFVEDRPPAIPREGPALEALLPFAGARDTSPGRSAGIVRRDSWPSGKEEP
jgi:hypothetical protein